MGKPLRPDAPRDPERNDEMWGRLRDIAAQVEWPVLFDGTIKVTKLSPEDWKHILTAGLQKQQRMAQGIEGGYVLLGLPTRNFSNKRMAELLALIKLFGDSKGVKWAAMSRPRLNDEDETSASAKA